MAHCDYRYPVSEAAIIFDWTGAAGAASASGGLSFLQVYCGVLHWLAIGAWIGDMDK
jgi:putative copper export protein